MREMHSQYIDPIEDFPNKIDQLFEALIYFNLSMKFTFFYIYLAVHESKKWKNIITLTNLCFFYIKSKYNMLSIPCKFNQRKYVYRQRFCREVRVLRSLREFLVNP